VEIIPLNRLQSHMNKRVLITGGAGFIGSTLAIEMVKMGYTVTILDCLEPQIHGSNPEESALFLKIKDITKFILGSTTDPNSWKMALQDQDIIVHLAAETGTGQSMYQIERYTAVNVLGTSLMWNYLANEKHTIKKIVIASSRAIYGEGSYQCPNHGIIFPIARKDEDMRQGDFNVKCPNCIQNVGLIATSETSLKNPSSIYGFTKQAQEEMSLIAGQSLGIPVVAFRYQNVFGPGQSLSNPYTGILSIFSKKFITGDDVSIFEDGMESRDFVFIDDVVSATVLGIENTRADFQSFNVGSGKATSVLQVANVLKGLFRSSSSIKVTGQYRIGDIRHNYADINKITHGLGYRPEVDFEQGIRYFVDWVNQQPRSRDTYDDAMLEMKNKGLFK
jgi:dTDP-L-rhamnose 4-epimerase